MHLLSNLDLGKNPWKQKKFDIFWDKILTCLQSSQSFAWLSVPLSMAPMSCQLDKNIWNLSERRKLKLFGEKYLKIKTYKHDQYGNKRRPPWITSAHAFRSCSYCEFAFWASFILCCWLVWRMRFKKSCCYALFPVRKDHFNLINLEARGSYPNPQRGWH